MQLSAICEDRNKNIIPGLLSAHHAVLHGDGNIVDMSTAENWAIKETLIPKVRKALARISEQDLAYASGVGGCTKTRTGIARLLNDHFCPSQTVDPSHIVLAAGGSFALSALIDQICDPGDAILIAAPYWPGLDIAISIHSRAEVVPVHVPLDEFFQPESVQYYEEALRLASSRARGVLICNPHNPLGQCYPRTTLHEMRHFCAKNNLHLISDEVYALSAHQPIPDDTVPFTSILSVDSEEAGKGNPDVHVIYSLSKDFGCNGIRVVRYRTLAITSAPGILTNPAKFFCRARWRLLTKHSSVSSKGALVNQTNTALRMGAALSVHSQVSTLSTFLASNVLLAPEAVEEVTSHGGSQCRQSYETVRSFLQGWTMDFIPVQYGVYVFARLAELNNQDEEAELQKCLKQRGVSVSTGTSYHLANPGWFRICYGMPLAELQRGLDRLDKGLKDYLQKKNYPPHN